MRLWSLDRKAKLLCTIGSELEVLGPEKGLRKQLGDVRTAPAADGEAGAMGRGASEQFQRQGREGTCKRDFRIPL